MRLLVGALLTIAIGWGVVLASPTPQKRFSRKHAERRAQAEQICLSQGPKCRLVVKPGAPRDLTGAACVCDP
jgi:hypothetical protein